MAREPEELVEMRRVLGAQLAAYRQAAELSQGQLAIATSVDRTTVAHIEKAAPALTSASGPSPTNDAARAVPCWPGSTPGKPPNRTVAS